MNKGTPLHKKGVPFSVAGLRYDDTMLTGKLVRVRYWRNRVVPVWLDGAQPEWHAAAEQLLDIFRNHIGRTRGELDEEVDEEFGDLPQPDAERHRRCLQVLGQPAVGLQLGLLYDIGGVHPAAHAVVHAVVDDADQERPVPGQQLVGGLGVAGLQLIQQLARFRGVSSRRHGEPLICVTANPARELTLWSSFLHGPTTYRAGRGRASSHRSTTPWQIVT
jgi:hypothetical protein